MRKLLSIILAGIMILSFTGCIEKDTKDNIDDLKSREGVMLVISSTIEGPIDYYDEDRLTGVTYSIDWDGTITMTYTYLSSGDVEVGKSSLSSEDYMTVYEFAEDAYLNDTYKDYVENDVMDGSTYGFRYYPADSSEGVHIFGGYCYSNEKLWNIISTAQSYFK